MSSTGRWVRGICSGYQAGATWSPNMPPQDADFVHNQICQVHLAIGYQRSPTNFNDILLESIRQAGELSRTQFHY